VGVAIDTAARMVACAPMAIFGLRYDLRRAPCARATHAELAAAALAQCEWADTRGFLTVTLSEHHGSPDGYLPSPMVMAAAVAARTRQLRIVLAAVIAPLHDPIRLAEDLAVVDVVSNGRLLPVLGAGYVESEFRAFGRALGERGRAVEEAVRVLEAAWTGEPFEHRGATVRVTPRPVQQPRPPIFLGGSAPAAARRAARIADGFVPAVPEAWEAYRAERLRLGHPDPGPYVAPLANFVHVARDPDAAWARIAPFALHETNAYARWAAGSGASSPYRGARDAGELRASGQYLVVTPEELVARARALPPLGAVMLHPLMGGLDPELGWESLRLVAEEVLPALLRPA
jgi:alkanesulfonate monooxygenase SsuD/methylene tetrahydromethanopterin reductase-like flavin-dependent oxidoreductase (luciferase family)